MNPAQHFLVLMVRVYRYAVSPLKTAWLGPSGRCRFTPSCSAYAQQAIRQHGAVRGSWLALKRLCRCHPWGGCGPDPVPEKTVRVSRLTSHVLRFTVHGSRFMSHGSRDGASPPPMTRREEKTTSRS